MHRVLNLTSTGTDAETLDQLKHQIRDKLTAYDTHTAEVNDGQNEEDQPTLAASVDFNDATEANGFHEWLKDLLTANREAFAEAMTRIHDCNHASDNNLPCKIGDVWRLG